MCFLLASEKLLLRLIKLIPFLAQVAHLKFTVTTFLRRQRPYDNLLVLAHLLNRVVRELHLYQRDLFLVLPDIIIVLLVDLLRRQVLLLRIQRRSNLRSR